MSIHIGAKKGDIAQTVLLPGDPLRAEFIAETFFENAFCFNEVRGMLGYTGRYGEKAVSVMGSGMGIPSISIYVYELINEYDVENIIRVGTCGALQPYLNIGDVIIAMSGSTDSHINRLRFNGMDYAPTADFPLLLKAYEEANQRKLNVYVGGVVSSDMFYADDPKVWDKWAEYGVLAVEMETAGLYTLAAKFKRRALAILAVTDNLVTEKRATTEQREKGFPLMAEIALEIAP